MKTFALKKKHSKLYEELILKSWWTLLFFFLCFFCYDQAVKRKMQEEEQLNTKLHHLLTEKKEALCLQQELKLQTASQDDEAWIELILMQKLGLVPSDQSKIHFVK